MKFALLILNHTTNQAKNELIRTTISKYIKVIDSSAQTTYKLIGSMALKEITDLVFLNDSLRKPRIINETTQLICKLVEDMIPVHPKNVEIMTKEWIKLQGYVNFDYQIKEYNEHHAPEDIYWITHVQEYQAYEGYKEFHGHYKRDSLMYWGPYSYDDAWKRMVIIKTKYPVSRRCSVFVGKLTKDEDGNIKCFSLI